MGGCEWRREKEKKKIHSELVYVYFRVKLRSGTIERLSHASIQMVWVVDPLWIDTWRDYLS